MEDGTNGGNFTPHGRAAASVGGAGLPGLLGRQGSGGFLPLRGGPPARFGDFPAVESHAGVWGRSAPKLSAGTLQCKPPQAALRSRWRSAPKLFTGTLQCKPPKAALGPESRSASQLHHIAGQSARLVRKNPQSQPHILFSTRRKENVPLTVQEKRAAGGAVPLWRTPPDPLLSAPRTDAVLLCISLREKVGPHSDGGWDQR